MDRIHALNNDCAELANILNTAHTDRMLIVKHVLKMVIDHWDVLLGDTFIMKVIIDVSQSTYHLLNRKQHTLTDEEWDQVRVLDNLTKKLKMEVMLNESSCINNASREKPPTNVV